MMTREEFVSKAMDCRPSETEWRDLIERALNAGAVNLKDAPKTYEAVFPLVGAMLEKLANGPINGSAYAAKRRKMRRAANRIRAFI